MQFKLDTVLAGGCMNDLVSIIIPVYNVEDYLDECIRSVVNQTYINLEILLINDGSTDSSEYKCIEWAKRDKRIEYLFKENEGLGPTRNYGIEKAKGKWIAFLDADDWYDLSYVEKMLLAAKKNNADMVTCNIVRYNMQTGEKSYMRCSSVIGIPLNREQKLEDDRMGVVTKFSLRDLWVKNGIKMPGLFGEDFAVTIWILAVSKKIVSLDECLYFYRKGRQGSVSTIAKVSREEMIIGAKYLVEGFERCGIYNKNKAVLKKNIMKNFSLVLTAGWTKLTESEYLAIRDKYQNYLCDEFEDYTERNLYHVGSYNMMQIIRYMPLLQDVSKSYLFSSIISIMHPWMLNVDINHLNPFRKKMIKRDINSMFLEKINNIDYIVMDFLEERHSVLGNSKGYLTVSDAFLGASGKINEGELILAFSKDWWKIWKSSWDDFVSLIHHSTKFIKLILVENYLTEEYGDINKKKPYPDLQEIKKINNNLKHCYEYAKASSNDIKLVNSFEKKYYFTDKAYEYGAYPWHLNDLVNRAIAEEIWKCIID